MIGHTARYVTGRNRDCHCAAAAAEAAGYEAGGGVGGGVGLIDQRLPNVCHIAHGCVYASIGAHTPQTHTHAGYFYTGEIYTEMYI